MNTWLVIDIAVLVVLDGVALWSLSRHRDSLGKWKVVRWVAFIVLVPLIGLLAYGTWRFETAVAQRDSAGGRDGSAPFLRSFDRDR